MYRVNNNDFKILSKYKSFLEELDDALENVPRKDMYFKDKIRDVSYDLLYLIIRCSYESNSEELIKMESDIKTHISLLDFFIERLFTKKYLSEKKAYKIGGFLVEINKMVNGFINNKVKDVS
ncbi:MAG: four helix bundle protein [Bacilli bacterium]|nr:four helix bundle protein [Bacilli bacterium]